MTQDQNFSESTIRNDDKCHEKQGRIVRYAPYLLLFLYFYDSDSPSLAFFRADASTLARKLSWWRLYVARTLCDDAFTPLALFRDDSSKLHTLFRDSASAPYALFRALVGTMFVLSPRIPCKYRPAFPVGNVLHRTLRIYCRTIHRKPSNAILSPEPNLSRTLK